MTTTAPFLQRINFYNEPPQSCYFTNLYQASAFILMVEGTTYLTAVEGLQSFVSLLLTLRKLKIFDNQVMSFMSSSARIVNSVILKVLKGYLF